MLRSFKIMIVIYAVVIWVVMAILTCGLFNLYDRYEVSVVRNEKNAALISYFADLGGRPEVLRQFERMRNVERAVMYDNDGLVTLPSERCGERFQDPKLFEKIVTVGHLVEITVEDGSHLYKRSQNGVAYLFVAGARSRAWLYISLFELIAGIGLSAVVVAAVRMFDQRAIEEKKEQCAAVNLIKRGIALEWRRFINKEQAPIVMLDKDLCLVDLNDVALQYLDRSEAKEGRHILDIVLGEDLKSRIVNSKVFVHSFENEIDGAKHLMFLE